jgi:hypothetical protein
MVLEGEVSDAELAEIGTRFTQHLAQSMQQTKAILAGNMLREAMDEKKHMVEVDFDGKD